MVEIHGRSNLVSQRIERVRNQHTERLCGVIFPRRNSTARASHTSHTIPYHTIQYHANITLNLTIMEIMHCPCQSYIDSVRIHRCHTHLLEHSVALANT